METVFMIFSIVVTIGVLVLASIGIAMLACVVFEMIRIWEIQRKRNKQKKVDIK